MKFPRAGNLIRQGLTLPELIIVVLIIAILLTVNLTFFRTIIATSSGRQVINELIGSMEIAKNVAIHSNQVVFFEFNLAANSYQAYRIQRESGEIVSASDSEPALPTENLTGQSPASSPEGALVNSSDLDLDFIISPTELPDTFQMIRISFPLGIQSPQANSSKIWKIVLTPQEIYDDFLIHFGPNPNEIRKTLIFEKYKRAARVLEGEHIYFLEDGTWSIENAREVLQELE